MSLLIATAMLVTGLLCYFLSCSLSKRRHLQAQLQQVNQQLDKTAHLAQHAQLANHQLIEVIKKELQMLTPYIVHVHGKEIEHRIRSLLSLASPDQVLDGSELDSLILLQPWLKSKLEGFHQTETNHTIIHARAMPALILRTNRELLDSALVKCCELLAKQDQQQTYLLDAEFGAHFELRLVNESPATGPLTSCHDVEYLFLAKRVTESGGEFGIICDGNAISSAVIRLPANLLPLEVTIPRPAIHQQGMADKSKPQILVVESDPEMLEWLEFHLSPEFRIIWCQNLQGAEYELEQGSPELILCDSLLDDGTAIDWLQTLRNREECSTIPFVICSMNACEQSRLVAWQASAEDCVRKSIEPMILIARLNALIENRRIIQQRMLNLALNRHKITEEIELDMDIKVENTVDNEFVEQLRLVFDRYLTSHELTVEFMAEQFHMSVRSYQRRIQAVFGISYTQYLKHVQFEIAKEALASGLSVKEAAFNAGFRDQAYFGRAFRKEFGVTPTQFKKALKPS